jgi:4-oxalocrotonate tautomerase
MPVVEITVVEGRTSDQLRALVRETTRAVSTTLEAPIESVRIIVREVPATHFAAGDVTIAERRAGAGGAAVPQADPEPAHETGAPR